MIYNIFIDIYIYDICDIIYFQILAEAAHKKTVLEAEAVADAQAMKVLKKKQKSLFLKKQ